MTRAARFAWTYALSNVEGLPSCPSDLSEPQYANLVFDQHCHVGSIHALTNFFFSRREKLI